MTNKVMKMKTIKLTEAQFEMLSEAWIAYAGNFVDVEISWLDNSKRSRRTWEALNKKLILPMNRGAA